MLRTSIVPILKLNETTGMDFIQKLTTEYFQYHGGYENAHKMKLTVLKNLMDEE